MWQYCRLIGMDKKDKMPQDYGRYFKQVHILLTSFSCHHSQLPHPHRYHHSNTHRQICATNRHVIHHNSNITDATPQTYVQATRLIHQTNTKPPIAHQSTHIFMTGGIWIGSIGPGTKYEQFPVFILTFQALYLQNL